MGDQRLFAPPPPPPPPPSALALIRRWLSRVAVDPVWARVELQVSSSSPRTSDRAHMIACCDELKFLDGPVISDELDGSAPRLQKLEVELDGIGVDVEEPLLRAAHLAKPWELP
ncbi:hypothetical protein DL765_007719 [Monosporascus sp. GIB2]|nr:hypothetical protein DL765_007719 [Monosporascus sp. GIB2]